MKRFGLLRQRLEYLAVVGLIRSIGSLPPAIACRLGGGLGRFFFLVDARHRRIALDNLRLAYGKDQPDRVLTGIAWASYQNLGYSIAELAQALNASRKEIAGQVEIEGMEHFRETHKQGKGVLYLTAHLGNWELMAIASALSGYPIGVVARPMDNPLLEDLLYRLRTRWGNEVIRKRGALREAMRRLKAGGTVGFLLDQNVARGQGVFVEFFGRPACTHKALALLAIKTGAPVLPAFTWRLAPGRHRIEIGPPIDLEQTGDLERDLVANTQRFTAMIERYVRRHPEQWLWVHRRWKTQPQ